MKVTPYKRRIDGKWTSIDGYSRADRPRHGRMKIKKKPITVRVINYTDQYGQLRPEREWKVIKR